MKSLTRLNKKLLFFDVIVIELYWIVQHVLHYLCNYSTDTAPGTLFHV